MVDTLKSTSITNSDASPVVANSVGFGSPGNKRTVNDYVTPTTGGLGSTSSVYKLVRVPANIKLKSLTLNADAALDSSTGLKFNVGAYYSDSTSDGTSQSLAGTLISANCFASALVFQSTYQKVNALTAFAVANKNKELWSALGLSANPGGFIDIAVAVQTVATTAVSANLDIEADFVE